MNDASLKSWPPHKYALETVQESGELDYGRTIVWARIEELFGYAREGETEWKFRAEWIEFCKLIKETGFSLTERGMHGEGVRVLQREEMADYVKTKEIAKANDSLRHSLMLSQVPREGLELREVKKLDHWETKSAVVGATSKVLLRKRSLPSPEMVTKSINQIAKGTE